MLDTQVAELTRFLAPHVYACVTADYVVFLDIRRNAFLGVAHGCVGTPALSEEMLKQGMLSTEASTRAPIRFHSPVGALFEGFVPFREPITFGLLANTALAFLSAWLAVRTGNVERCVRHATERAERRRPRPEPALDGFSVPQDLQRLVSAYFHCRAWLVSTAGKCLLDSLALTTFLSRYGIAASLTIGVRTAPFGAHAWVQRDGLVLNDQCEIVCAYDCIFASRP